MLDQSTYDVFHALPRRLFWKEAAAVALWFTLCAGFVVSVATAPAPRPAPEAPAASVAAVPDPCPPQCVPAKG